MRVLAILFLLLPASIAGADFAGPAACGGCHADLATKQGKTNMARTWIATNALKPAAGSEGKMQVRVKDGTYTVAQEGGVGTTLPVEYAVGGPRHGISFLTKVESLGVDKLARSTLIETRFMQAAHGGGLVLSPGFPVEGPTGLETSLGRALAPDFERQCLNCHGQPSVATGAGGVHCESCHGPGGSHVESKGKVRTAQQDELAQCESCHGGFARLSDPLPDDLMISNQVNALKNSECFRNGSGLKCSSCHDPHEDGTKVRAKSVAACKACHSATLTEHAAICPVNSNDSCTTCHMPEVKRGPFLLVDHWIRAPRTSDAIVQRSSTVRPKRLYLRLIVTTEESKAALALAELQSGKSFFDVARSYSSDASAQRGGFLGDMQLDTMAPSLADAAAALVQGTYSPVIRNGGKFFIVQRVNSDFREQANKLMEEGTRFRLEHRLDEASERYRQALSIYPYFLRGLIFFAGTLGEQGDAQRAAAILQFAGQLYPQDPAAPYNLGVTLATMGRATEEAAAYRKTIALEPSLIGAYLNLGASLLAEKQVAAAEQVFRDGLQQDPLSAALYYNLSLVQEQQGLTKDAAASVSLARKLNPVFVRAQRAGAQ